MIELTLLLLFNCLYIFGFYNSTDYSVDVNKKYQEGEILGRLGYMTENIPQWLRKPLLGCVMCMASIHSFPFWMFNDFTLLNGGVYILYIFALSGLNALVYEGVTNR